MKNKRKNALSLVELIVVIAVLAIFSSIAASMLSSAIRVKRVGSEGARAQIALRQSALMISRELRRNPLDSDPLGIVENRYSIRADGALVRNYDDAVIATGMQNSGRPVIAVNPDGKATIFLHADNGRTLEIVIHLRTDIRRMQNP
jgi:prepilin-type N-terminal cleavage/methylation domain-containing protein